MSDDIQIQFLSSPGQYPVKAFAFTWEVILIGDFGIGKSNFISRFTRDEFHPEIKDTKQPESVVCAIKIDGKLIKVLIWDPCGLERFHRSSFKDYYRKATGALLLYDITNQTTFNNAREWLKELREGVGENVMVTLVGNKSDQRHHRKVPTNAAKAFAEETKLSSFLEASALDATNLKLAFEKTFAAIYAGQRKTIQISETAKGIRSKEFEISKGIKTKTTRKSKMCVLS